MLEKQAEAKVAEPELSIDAYSLGEPQRYVVWDRGDHPPLVVRAGGCDACEYGDPIITDETLEQIQPDLIQPGDIVGIGIHTGNALRGMEVGRMARERGAWVVYGGIHATLYPEEARKLGGAHVVVKGDGDVVWGQGNRRPGARRGP